MSHPLGPINVFFPHTPSAVIADWPFAMLNPKHNLKATSPAYLEMKQNKPSGRVQVSSRA